MAIRSALAECDAVEVVGFGPACADNGTRLPGIRIYYDPRNAKSPARESFYGFHDMEAEWRWLRRLVRAGTIRWLDRQCHAGHAARVSQSHAGKASKASLTE